VNAKIPITNTRGESADQEAIRASSFMKPTPLVSVVVPLGNTVAYAPLAFWSIHNQTCLDWECIIIVDGGPEALDLAHRMSEIDERFKVYPNHGKGLVSALNLGISLSRGTYIARMDGDDVMFPNRLDHQLGLLESTPSLSVVGTQVMLVNKVDQPLSMRHSFPTNPRDVEARLRSRNVIAHPTVMARKKTITDAGCYRSIFQQGEDYDLWLRVTDHQQIGNSSEVLLALRKHDKNMSITNLETTIGYTDLAKLYTLRRRAGKDEFLFPPPLNQAELRLSLRRLWLDFPLKERVGYLSYWLPPSSRSFVQSNYLSSLIRSFLDRSSIPRDETNDVLEAWHALYKRWTSRRSVWDPGLSLDQP